MHTNIAFNIACHIWVYPAWHRGHIISFSWDLPGADKAGAIQKSIKTELSNIPYSWVSICLLLEGVPLHLPPALWYKVRFVNVGGGFWLQGFEYLSSLPVKLKVSNV